MNYFKILALIVLLLECLGALLGEQRQYWISFRHSVGLGNINTTQPPHAH